MSSAIHQVFKFVSEQPTFSATVGIVHSRNAAKTLTLWGAYNPESGESWVPELEDIQLSWADAQWTPVSQQQAGLFDVAYQNEQRLRQEWLHSI